MTVLDDTFLKDQSRARWGTIWLGGLLGLGLLALLLKLFDSTTELAPAHEGITTFCLIAATLLCLASAVIGFRVRRTRSVVGRLFRGAWYALLGFLAVYFSLLGCATIVAGWSDFPARRTLSSSRLIAIASASHRVGSRGGESWSVRALSFDATFNITRDDYGFMLAHRRPDDDASEPDAIASNGYFCARVTVEQAGDALRVMHAGSHKLPQGSIILCPARAATL
ncbi:hypothetical protein BH10PSE14_BH10PSE14_01710 [soil metagenome]